MVTLGTWNVLNIHAESNSNLIDKGVSRDIRERQYEVLANCHHVAPQMCYVVIGDFNM